MDDTRSPTRLTAHRADKDEPTRLIRVAKALGILDCLSGTPDLPIALHDHKGCLSVNWRSLPSYEEHAGTIGRAWICLDGTGALVEHFVQGEPVSLWEGDAEFSGEPYSDLTSMLYGRERVR